nr:olfactory receptor 84 [Gregopimpla kuwanae]
MWDEAHLRIRIRGENLKSAGDVSFVGKCYVTMVIILVTSYAVRPYILLLHHHWYEKHTNISYDYTETVYPTNYPFSTETMTAYIMCISWEQVVIVFVALYWMSSDTIFAQLTTHTAIQFRVLRHDLEFITAADENDITYKEKDLVDRLCIIARRHHDLYMYCEIIETIYNPIIFLTMLLTGANMCFCVFRVEKELSHGNWDEVIKYLFHAVTLVVQAVIYCGYADKLTQQSSLMAKAAYDCKWVQRSKEFKILLQIIMMRSQKPFNCTAYGFFSVNLNQITVIANTAASYFALLKTMT